MLQEFFLLIARNLLKILILFLMTKGVFDMCFMLAYAFGLFFNDWVGNHCHLKSFLAIGSVISLSVYLIFLFLQK